MTSPGPGPRRAIPNKRSFGPVAELGSSNEDAIAGPSQPRRFLGHLSFSSQNGQRKRSFLARLQGNGDEETGEPTSERAIPIPSALKSSDELDSTPLPKLSMIVLSVTMLGEFLSANVSTPFLLFMVRGFGETVDEASVAFWTGIIVSAFFMTQFITSLLWATIADKHGRRAVLCISLLGSAITCSMFGTTKTLQQAIVIRLLQGIFAGAVGVARGSVAFVTDASNEGRAYAIMGFCWGLGGVAGAIIGGSFETPAQKWPSIFGQVPLFVNYPYLLPCLIASSITLTGSILSCFLGPDGGPREGAIHLPPDEDHQYPATIAEEEEEDEVFHNSAPTEDSSPKGVVDALKKKVSGYFASRVHDAHRAPTSPASSLPQFTSEPSEQPSVPMSNTNRDRTFSRSSRAVDGSAYGYGSSGVAHRSRLGSMATAGTRRGSVSASLRRRRGSNPSGANAGTGTQPGEELNFAQRLLMANENAVTNIADLWVAAAINADNEEVFESDFEETPEEGSTPVERHRAGSGTNARLLSATSTRPAFILRDSRSRSPSPGPRRFSNSPGIFAHSGVRTPPAVIDAQQLLERTEDIGALAPIMEGVSRQASENERDPSIFLTDEKPPSLMSQLPVLIIVQYGLLAFYSTTHDQIFMSYLVSPYEAGGLNLNAGHFAQLIALMCLAQIAYQFYLYPNVGPPRGRFSHLAMFRLGCFLFIPSFLVVILFRPFASSKDDGNLLVMTFLAFSTALRYCATTFAYTAISILLNYMTPPNAVGIANGIAQSIVSLARCFGPVMGGYLWSMSVQDGPSGYPLGFIIVAGVCGLAVLQSFMIR